MARKGASIEGMRTFLDAMNEAGQRRSAANPKAQPNPIDPDIYDDEAIRTETWRQSLIEALDNLPGLIPGDLINLLINDPNPIHISILMFSTFSADVISNLINAAGHLNELNKEAFPYVRQTLRHGDLDIISSYLITLTKIIPYHFSDGDAVFKKFVRKCLGSIVSHLSKVHLLSEALTNRTEQLSRRKDRILEEFGPSEFIVTDDMNYKSKASKQRAQKIDTQAVPILVRQCDDVELRGKPWGSYDWTTRECVILFILRKVDGMLKSWTDHLTISLKILKNTDLGEIDSIKTLIVESNIDKAVLLKISTYFENNMVEVLEAGALSHLGFSCLSSYRRPLKKVKRNLSRSVTAPTLPKAFRSLEFYVCEKEFLELLDATPPETLAKLSKLLNLTGGKFSGPKKSEKVAKSPKPRSLGVVTTEPRNPTENPLTLTVIKKAVALIDSGELVGGTDSREIVLKRKKKEGLFGFLFH